MPLLTQTNEQYRKTHLSRTSGFFAGHIFSHPWLPKLLKQSNANSKTSKYCNKQTKLIVGANIKR